MMLDGRMSKKPPDEVLTMPLDELKKRIEKALALVAQIDELFPGLIELTDEARRHTNGRYRNGEAEALESLVDLAEKKPALFESLANADEGHDPKRFEHELLRDRLERAILLGPLVTALLDLASSAADTRLYFGELTRPVLLAMYEITKPHAKRDPSIASICKRALDFFSAIARTAAATRKRNKREG
jgi:hypothetical protein